MLPSRNTQSDGEHQKKEQPNTNDFDFDEKGKMFQLCQKLFFPKNKK